MIKIFLSTVMLVSLLNSCLGVDSMHCVYKIVLKLLFLKAGHRWGKVGREGIGFLPSTLPEHENPLFDICFVKVI